MTDIAIITTTLAAITNSIAIAKAIKSADSTLEKAELKLKIAELIESLADAKINATEFQDLIKEKDGKIRELEEILKVKSNLVRQNGMYYETNENGEIEGEPYCSKCWEVENLIIHLIHLAEERYKCPHCENTFGPRLLSWDSYSRSTRTY